MLKRLSGLVVVALLAAACGSAQEEARREGIKAATPAKADPTEESEKINAKLAEVGKTAQQSLEKEEIEPVPVTTTFYLLNDAFEASGFRWEALRRKLDEHSIAGVSYVKLTRHADRPEEAHIYDAMGNHVNIVSYLWDADFNIYGAVYKSANDRMLGMHLFCKSDGVIYAHPLSTFRVHAPYTLKLSLGENSVAAEMVDGHDDKRELAAWPLCNELEAGQKLAKPYESPFGVHKQLFSFDEGGNLVSAASYGLGGALVEDVRGVAKVENLWKDGRLQESSLFTADELLSRYLYEYDDKGRVSSRKVVDATGRPTVDYLGFGAYEYTYEKRDRAATEVRRDPAGNVVEKHEYTYGRLAQLEEEKVFDGAGNLQTTYARTFNKKGALTEYAIHDGDKAAGKLRTDFNQVALYRFDYTEKGRLLKESRHGTARVLDKEGKEDYLLTNALDGWALIEVTYDAEAQRDVVTTVYSRVDGSGNRIFEELTDKDSVLAHRIERTFEGSAVLSQVKTLFTEEVATKRLYLDGQDVVTRAALLKYNAEGLLMEEANFAADETTPVLALEGYHKLLKTYTEEGKIKSDSFYDLAGNKVKTTTYEYGEDGSYKGTKSYDGQGKEIPQ